VHLVRLAEVYGAGEWTADTIEQILALESIVTITRVDENGLPFFHYVLPAKNGQPEYHSSPGRGERGVRRW
jgi:hypothetical protein